MTEDQESLKALAKIKSLNEEIDKLVSNRDGIMAWTNKQVNKLSELALKAKDFDEDFKKKRDLLESWSKSLASKESNLKALEEASLTAKEAAQIEKKAAMDALTELNRSRQDLVNKEHELNAREASLNDRETMVRKREEKMDEAFSYIKSIRS